MANEASPPSGLDTVATEVVLAVAESLGVDPLTLDPLAETIDPGALESLVRSKGVEISFEYQGYQISIGRYDEVELIPT